MIDRLQSHMKENNIDLSLVISLDEQPNTNMIYLAGYKGLGILAVTQDDAYLLVPEMEYEKATQSKLRVVKAQRRKKLFEQLSSIDASKVGIEENRVTVAMYKKLQEYFKMFVDIGKAVQEMRMIKTDEELEMIRKACEVTDTIFAGIIDNFTFKTEEHLRDFILESIKRHGCTPSFPPIVASGNGSSQPHYEDLGEIKEGFLLLDFGAKYEGYCADMSRTLYIGKPTKEEKEDYALVLKALEESEKQTAQKKYFGQLYDTAVEVLADKAEYFTHALGHGVGLDIHELPSLTPEDDHEIQENISFTIEPAIYFQGNYGIRIEDTVVLRDGKLDVLTESKKELVIIEKIE